MKTFADPSEFRNDFELLASKELLVESILCNCFNARIEMDDDAFFRAKGNSTDCGLLQFLMQNNYEVHDEQQAAMHGRIVTAIPFTSVRMMVTTVVKHPDQEGMLRVYTKGAPEYALKCCVYYFDEKGKKRTFQERQRRRIVHDFVIEKIAKTGNKPLAICYKDIKAEDYQKMLKKYNGLKTESDKMKAFESQMCLLALVGIKDELRDDIKEVVENCKIGGITLRVITSENLWTARFLAIRCGILSK